jgi:DNA-binding NarL/FixJ family response regulator
LRSVVAPGDPEVMALRCLIVDDNERFLEAASEALGRDGIEVVGTAATTAEAIRQAHELRPDVVVVDIGLGEESGFELTQQLVQEFPGLRSGVVLTSTSPQEEYAALIATSPAIGFVPKMRLSAEAVEELLRSTRPNGS